jgi:hypothetical protein
MLKISKIILFALIAQFISATESFTQVQRTVAGKSIIRENIQSNLEFHFFRDWSKSATFKSGIGESVELFPVIFNTPNNSIILHGLQLEAEVKPRNNQMINSFSATRLRNKDFITRSIFLDKDDVGKMISYIDRDIIPHLKDSYKLKSKEYVFKSREMFFSFLIDEKDARITIHIVDYGPLGNGDGGGDQIEFWTETKIEEIPKFLSSIKTFYSSMK